MKDAAPEQLPPVYLDYAASTPVREEILRGHAARCRRWFVNPHGTSNYAEQARRAVLDAERRLLELLDIPVDEARVVWTSGGTEADNLACCGTLAGAAPASLVYVDAAAHSAMLEPCRANARRGGSCVEIPLDRWGRLQFSEALDRADGRDADLVAVCQVNNETGAQCDLVRVRSWMERNVPRACLAVDAVQALGRVPIPWRTAGIDLLCLSARKIGGPAAVGALVVRRGVVLQPQVLGGDQQHGLRAGTLDVVGILECVEAVEAVQRERLDESQRLEELKRMLCQGLSGLTRYAPLVLSPEDASPAICSIAFPGYEGAVLMRLLAARGVLVSAGSACHAESAATSHVLRAMGIAERTARGALRISFGRQSCAEHVQRLLAELARVLEAY